jgi:hypothetical protein
LESYHIRIIGNDGQIEDRVDVLCGDDEEAIRIAKKFADGRAVELWHGKRKIASLNQKE